MKIMCIGDISGRPGRETVAKLLPQIKANEGIDFVIANCENAAGGYGITRQILDELSGYGIDFFTSGDHVWKISDFLNDLQDLRLPLVRPYNYEQEEQIPGKGYEVIDMGSEKLVIINMLGQVFMHEFVRNPFWSIDSLLEKLKEDGVKETDAIIIDFHAEATAEKISFAYYLAERVSAVVGTHTHVPTADARIIGRAAFVSDLGMVGPLDASLWAGFDEVIHNFKYPFKKAKQMQTQGRRVFNSVVIEIIKGKAVSINRLDRTISA
ncbi:MAG: hypothetical protein UZ20_WS6002000985 [candidate division WS6 bacterium OLB21]|uniref:Metallophosphoesterase n=1 Tax=candidate division WS6 bacterium OLB21 TaxID=1617427 RepID=A0A136KF81_9BACT|nr:MAG: hypothetical protein UZ20_WS6002000985 [candidate division WS6 bacterium OLB21]